MAEEAIKEKEEGDENGDTGKKASSKIPKIAIMIVSGLILMIVLTAVIAMFVTKEPKIEEPMVTFELGPMYSLDPFVVNLIDYNGRRYLKTDIDLELSNDKMLPEVNQKVSFIRNITINILSSKTFRDVSSIEGKDSLRREMVYRINRALTQGKIKNVYFKEFVIQ